MLWPYNVKRKSSSAVLARRPLTYCALALPVSFGVER
jgi:hypothetical protein